MFSEGRPLGKDGLKWLKIHLVNLHGVKKKWVLIACVSLGDLLPCNDLMYLQSIFGGKSSLC